MCVHFHPIRSKTKTNRDSLTCVFAHFTSATCAYYLSYFATSYRYFELWLAHCIICVMFHWLLTEWLCWFWFYDIKEKTAVMHNLDKYVINKCSNWNNHGNHVEVYNVPYCGVHIACVGSWHVVDDLEHSQLPIAESLQHENNGKQEYTKQ